jgi:hypothetical protein
MARALLVLSALLTPLGLAAADPESVHIDYGSPASCPDAAAFMRSLQARTTRFRLTEEEQGRRFFVRVTAAGSGFAGRLEIRGSDGRTANRSVDGAVCEEVAEALALMTALAIDPNALMTVPKAGGKDAGNSSQKISAQEASQRLAPVTVIDPPSSAKASEPWQWSAGMLGHMTSGLSPNLGYGGQLFVEAEAPPSSRLGPALRVGIFFNQSDVELSTGAAARFQWALATGGGCAVRLAAMGQRLAVTPCLALRLGLLRGEGQRISQPQQTVSAWVDAGPVLQVRFAVMERLILEVQGALMAPLYRPTFEITDMGKRTTAYSVPRLGGLLGMGLSYRFR